MSKHTTNGNKKTVNINTGGWTFSEEVKKEYPELKDFVTEVNKGVRTEYVEILIYLINDLVKTMIKKHSKHTPPNPHPFVCSNVMQCNFGKKLAKQG